MKLITNGKTLIAIYLLCAFVFGLIIAKVYPKMIYPLFSNIMDTNHKWDDSFKLATIKSTMDGQVQKAYFFKTTEDKPQPLIVSLHNWGGTYAQFDSLSILCKNNNVNYIHPDFRGPNSTIEACVSEKVIRDIDDAISFGIKNSNVDPDKICIVGASGGGYAAVGAYMKSKHKLSKVSAWVPITDLEAWYNEGIITKNNFVEDILKCTSSINGILNIEEAKKRSPVNWKTPHNQTELSLYTGIYDGIRGSVSISHSLNFYNKILVDLKVKDSTKYVSEKEKLHLLEKRTPLGLFGQISNRDIFLKKKNENIQLILFEGDHEILNKYAIESLLK